MSLNRLQQEVCEDLMQPAASKTAHLIHEAIESLASVSAAAEAVLLSAQHEGAPRLQRLCLARRRLQHTMNQL